MSQPTPAIRKPGTTGPAPARAAAPGGANATGRQLVRISFASPVFGMGEYSWTFICEGAQAEDIQAAMMERKPVKLVFPSNVVVLDTANVVLADFQPAPTGA